MKTTLGAPSWLVAGASVLAGLLAPLAIARSVSPYKLTPKGRVLEVLDLLFQTSLYVERLGEREVWIRRFSGSIRSHHQADEAIQELVAAVADRHTRYEDSTASQESDAEDDATGLVCTRVIEGGIGHLKISQFGTHCADEVQQALQGLQSATALILDLRGNLGGLVKQAHQVYSLLADDGPISHLEGRRHDQPYEETVWLTRGDLVSHRTDVGLRRRTRRCNLWGDNQKMVVLVDEHTASASELLAGALQANGRALIVGSQTTGKGVEQATIPLDGGSALVVTFGRLHLPDGRCIHGVGLTPDVPVQQCPDCDWQLATAVKTLTGTARVACQGS